MKTGLGRAPSRALLKAMGLTDEEIGRPLIGIANSANELVPDTFISIESWKR